MWHSPQRVQILLPVQFADPSRAVLASYTYTTKYYATIHSVLHVSIRIFYASRLQPAPPAIERQAHPDLQRSKKSVGRKLRRRQGPQRYHRLQASAETFPCIEMDRDLASVFPEHHYQYMSGD